MLEDEVPFYLIYYYYYLLIIIFTKSIGDHIQTTAAAHKAL